MSETERQEPRLPDWLKRNLAHAGNDTKVAKTIANLKLNTVCSSAICPNKQECWSRGTATFMILGDFCTRDCKFCAVGHGKPAQVDPSEAERLAKAIKFLDLKHVVITSVTRDDLPDQGSRHFARVINTIRKSCPQTNIEVLIPDFSGNIEYLKNVTEARPYVLTHNVETVQKLTPIIRYKADYKTSLKVLKNARELLKYSFVKSGIMVGLGETIEDLEKTMDDLRESGCDILTIGQYLRPTKKQVPVVKYYSLEEFALMEKMGIKKGFHQVVSTPLARSSYHADEIMHFKTLVDEE